MYILDKETSIANLYLSEIRDLEIQKDRQKFRKNIERLGEIMAYEISRELSYQDKEIQTPLGTYRAREPVSQPVLLTILRAGLPFFQGFLNVFDQADGGFIGSYRATEGDKNEIEIKLEYEAMPGLEGRDVILIDPMLATGKSLVSAVEQLKGRGIPAHLYIVSVIAAPEGVDFIKNNLDINYSIWTASLDEHLNNKAYIVPGLGDAGDLSYGPKH